MYPATTTYRITYLMELKPLFRMAVVARGACFDKQPTLSDDRMSDGDDMGADALEIASGQHLDAAA
ncbi:hypothetical protein BMJ30_12680 [Sinorhizobium medicae]|nr:hypothetical protein BMJ30_12680 [Sinorhizobium medicae]PLU35708.1 hypothetical protein BMJ27_12435 [Sinorhizobium medicae]